MKFLKKILKNLKFPSFFKKRGSIRRLFSLKSLRGLKLGLFLGVLALIISSSGVLYVYSQSAGSVGGSSLNKGLIAHWTLDADEYEEGTVNLYNGLNFSLMTQGGITYSYVGIEDGWLKYSISGTGNSNTYPYTFNIRPMDILLSQRTSVSFKYKTNVSHKYHNWSTTPVMVNIAYASGMTRTDTIEGDYRNIKIENVSPASGAEVQYQPIYFYSRPIEGQVFNPSTDFIYFKDVQIERKPYATDFVSGTRVDRVVESTPYENHGTNYGATPTTDRNGKVGGAMSFNGVSNRISISYPNPVNETSVVAWFKRSGSPAGGYHIITGGGNIEISIPDSSGQIRTGVTTNTQGRKFFNSGSGLNDGNWHQVAMTYDGVNLKSFIDGQITATNPVSGNLVGIAGEIGRFLSDSYVTNGSIDDVRIYNRALSDDEISLLYDSYELKTQISSINSGLVGHWTLSEEDYNSNTHQVTDKTPYSNNGTNLNATFVADRHGKAGGAMSFSSGNIVSILNNNSFDTSSLSISFWVYHRDYTYSKTFSPIKKSSPNCYATGGKGWDFGHGYKSDGVDVCVADGNNIVRQTLIFNTDTKPSNLLNKWTHITYVIDRSQNKVLAYINGVKQSSEVNIATITGSINNISNLIIGNLYGWVFDGSIDDVRLYNRALSADEINLLYSSYSPQTGGDNLQKGLVLDMPLTSKYTKTETSGSQIMTDRTPYGNDGINNGGLVTDNYTSFNGTNQYIYNIDTANPALLEPSAITVSSWINLDPDASTERHIWFTKWLGYSNEIAATTRIPYLRLNGPGDIVSSVPIIPGAWHHFVGTYDASIGGRVYLDGVLVGTKAASGAITHSRSYPLSIGRYSGGIYFKGKIANARIYNRSLSESEVKLLYTQGAASLGGVPIYRKSCKEILDANPNNLSGVYQIKPIPTELPFSVYCDMTTDGGGWTLVEKDYGGSATVPVSSASDTNTAILTDQTWSTVEGKFADSKFKAIWLAGDRELLWKKSTGEYVKMRFSVDFINNWFSNFAYTSRPTGVFQEFYRYADSTWYAINGHSNNWHFSSYNDSRNVSPYSIYLIAKNQNDGDSYWPTRSNGLMDNTSFMFQMYIR